MMINKRVPYFFLHTQHIVTETVMSQPTFYMSLQGKYMEFSFIETNLALFFNCNLPLLRYKWGVFIVFIFDCLRGKGTHIGGDVTDEQENAESELDVMDGKSEQFCDLTLEICIEKVRCRGGSMMIIIMIIIMQSDNRVHMKEEQRAVMGEF